MKTLAGSEVKFCRYCGTELIIKPIYNTRYIVCPKFFKYKGIAYNYDHDVYRAPLPNPRYDPVTGERLI